MHFLTFVNEKDICYNEYCSLDVYFTSEWNKHSHRIKVEWVVDFSSRMCPHVAAVPRSDLFFKRCL